MDALSMLGPRVIKRQSSNCEKEKDEPKRAIPYHSLDYGLSLVLKADRFFSRDHGFEPPTYPNPFSARTERSRISDMGVMVWRHL